ncbi:hypothetical protein [Variovorax sp. PMC12]|uniref:hypothetical protein n=1 Tax=Variovorax sp. PMC12 TaxID=2126319 RepID=UPI000D13C76E|nr:hypothetical protein [Variovorax sp. PMC12]AVQ81631.1 hypothetical protein C4F17_12115 [Variovorax sp. PMC12]
MSNLFISMTEAVIRHWKANDNAYPKKFVLAPEQHKGYVASRRAGIGGPKADVSEHMGVPVEVVEGSPGVMVAADGTEVSLQ